MPLASAWADFFPLAIWPELTSTEIDILSNVMYGCGLESPRGLIHIALDKLLLDDNDLPTNLDHCSVIVQAHMVVAQIALRDHRDDEV